MMTRFKKWLKYRRLKKAHLKDVGFLCWAGNWRIAHRCCERARRLRCKWKGQPYNHFPYMESIRMMDPQFHDLLTKLNINWE